MADNDNGTPRSRQISFRELAGDMVSFQPAPARSRRAIKATDPYFTVLDNGREVIVNKKRCGEMVEALPKELQQIVNELDQLMKEMTYDAVTDDFDYQAQMDNYYFRMIRVSQLCQLLKFKMRRFTKNQKAIEKFLGDYGKKRVTEFLERIANLCSAVDDLSLSCELFMDGMEKNYDILLPEQIRERELSMQRTMAMLTP
ncbi:MAG: hypothetical protein K6G16_08105 [Lachnospiraceae bacterium]|nr:hypothetical protein [Lachnospiraceae bacterium]